MRVGIMAWASRNRDERGMSLAELMVTVGILSVVMAAVLGIMASVQSGVNRQIKLATSLDQAHLASVQLDREIRSATAMSVPGGSNGMEFNAYTQTNVTTGQRATPMCVQWRVSGQTLQSRMWPYPAGAGPYLWRSVATNIVNQTPTENPGTPAPMFDIPAGYGGRLVEVTVLANANPHSAANPGGSRTDATVQTYLTGRNIAVGSVNPCNVLANQPA